jgi:hypothetical protein
MEVNLHRKIIKYVIANLKSTAATVLSPEEYKGATFTYNKSNGKIDIKNLSKESIAILEKAIEDRIKEKPLIN